MKRKKIVVLFILSICFVNLMTIQTWAMDEIIVGMKEVSQVSGSDTSGGIGKVLNSIIRLIQVAGTGISVIIVTMLGIKYMLASSSEKAEIKKMAMPIVIGCVLLIAAVNLVGIIAGIGDGLN